MQSQLRLLLESEAEADHVCKLRRVHYFLSSEHRCTAPSRPSRSRCDIWNLDRLVSKCIQHRFSPCSTVHRLTSHVVAASELLDVAGTSRTRFGGCPDLCRRRCLVPCPLLDQSLLLFLFPFPGQALLHSFCLALKSLYAIAEKARVPIEVAENAVLVAARLASEDGLSFAVRVEMARCAGRIET